MGTRLVGMPAPRKTRERGAGGYPCATPYLNFFPFRFGIVNTSFGLVNTHFGKPEKRSRSTETAVHHQPKSLFTFNRNERSPSTEIRSSGLRYVIATDV